MRAQRAYETALTAAAAEKSAEVARVQRACDELRENELKLARVTAEQELLAAVQAARRKFEASQGEEMAAVKRSADALGERRVAETLSSAKNALSQHLAELRSAMEMHPDLPRVTFPLPPLAPPPKPNAGLGLIKGIFAGVAAGLATRAVMPAPAPQRHPLRP